MSNNTIVMIREAEEKADAKLLSAKEEADKIILCAKRSADDKKASAALLCAKIAKDTKIKAAADASAVIEGKTEEAKNEVKEIIASAEAETDSAVGIIIREIFEKWQ